MENNNLPEMTDEQRKAKADDIMRKLGIAENRRVQGLGSRQREGIVELVAKLK